MGIIAWEMLTYSYMYLYTAQANTIYKYYLCCDGFGTEWIFAFLRYNTRDDAV